MLVFVRKPRRVFEALVKIRKFQIRVVVKNLLPRHATGEKLQHKTDADAHAANTRSALHF